MALSFTQMWIPRSQLPYKSRMAVKLTGRWQAQSWFGLNRDQLRAITPRKWPWTKWLENRRSNASISLTWWCYRLSDTSSPQCPVPRSKWSSTKNIWAIDRTWADTIALEWQTQRILTSRTLSSIVIKSWQGTHHNETWLKKVPQTCQRSKLWTKSVLAARQPRVIGARLNLVRKSLAAFKQAKIRRNKAK